LIAKIQFFFDLSIDIYVGQFAFYEILRNIFVLYV